MDESKSRYYYLHNAKNMPALFHKLPGEEFDYDKSEVVNWLLQLPEVKEHIFNHAKRSGYIRFNRDTGKWCGLNNLSG